MCLRLSNNLIAIVYVLLVWGKLTSSKRLKLKSHALSAINSMFISVVFILLFNIY